MGASIPKSTFEKSLLVFCHLYKAPGDASHCPNRRPTPRLPESRTVGLLLFLCTTWSAPRGQRLDTEIMRSCTVSRPVWQTDASQQSNCLHRQGFVGGTSTLSNLLFPEQLMKPWEQNEHSAEGLCLLRAARWNQMLGTVSQSCQTRERRNQIRRTSHQSGCFP